MLMREASRTYKWNLNFGAIALMWRGGCIIRSRFLGDIKRAFDTDPELTNLLLDQFFIDAMKEAVVCAFFSILDYTKLLESLPRGDIRCCQAGYPHPGYVFCFSLL